MIPAHWHQIGAQSVNPPGAAMLPIIGVSNVGELWAGEPGLQLILASPPIRGIARPGALPIMFSVNGDPYDGAVYMIARVAGPVAPIVSPAAPPIILSINHDPDNL